MWFQVCWHFATSKEGIFALELKRTLEIGSYQTAWAMLHRLRAVLMRPGRELLSSPVEVDETYIGGKESGLAGGRAKDKKALVEVGVEVAEPNGFGRVRTRVIDDASAVTLHRFITDNVEPDATVATDDWSGYRDIGSAGFTRDRRNQTVATVLGATQAHRCPVCTAPRHWSKDGSQPPIKAPSNQTTCRPNSTSSTSVSTGGIPPPAACCSTAYCSSRSATTPFASAP